MLQEIRKVRLTFKDGLVHELSSSLPLLEVVVGGCREVKRFMLDLVKFEVNPTDPPYFVIKKLHNGIPHWYTAFMGDLCPHHEFTEAVRFSRRQDAELVISGCYFENCEIVEVKE